MVKVLLCVALGVIAWKAAKAWRKHSEYKRRMNRPHMQVDFSESISREDLNRYATIAVNSINGKNIEFVVREAVVIGVVESNTGLSTWEFSVDFNDYGHITGEYWLEYDNHDSPIPEVVAEKINTLILAKLSGEMRGNEEKQNVYCRYCGREIDNNSIFCSHCGKQLSVEKADK